MAETNKPSFGGSVLSGIGGFISGAFVGAFIGGAGGGAIGALAGTLGIALSGGLSAAALPTIGLVAAGGAAIGALLLSGIGAVAGTTSGVVLRNRVDPPSAEEIGNVAKVSLVQGMAFEHLRQQAAGAEPAVIENAAVKTAAVDVDTKWRDYHDVREKAKEAVEKSIS